ncbi:hypothetical protein ACPESR_25220 [Nocardia testacea]|uniref:hypothetical protein n=1 Tax=Nocardia testacea TaxID=248551 RepID=UPI003C2B9BAB
MAEDVEQETCTRVARIVIERHINEHGQHMVSHAVDEAGQPLDPIVFAGLLELAKVRHLGLGCRG